jgi:hypothetical protein
MEPSNPYSSSNFGDRVADSGGLQRMMNPTILSQIRVVAILLIVHGVLLLVMGVFLVVLAVAMPQMLIAQQQKMPQQPGAPDLSQMKTILTATYGIMGLAGLIPGVIQIIAGIRNLRLRGRTFGLVAIISGAISLGTCYCAPTAIGLLIYGLIIYLHDTAKQAFELGEQGKTWREIESISRNT